MHTPPACPSPSASPTARRCSRGCRRAPTRTRGSWPAARACVRFDCVRVRVGGGGVRAHPNASALHTPTPTKSVRAWLMAACSSCTGCPRPQPLSHTTLISVRKRARLVDGRLAHRVQAARLARQRPPRDARHKHDGRAAARRAAAAAAAAAAGVWCAPALAAAAALPAAAAAAGARGARAPLPAPAAAAAAAAARAAAAGAQRARRARREQRVRQLAEGIGRLLVEADYARVVTGCVAEGWRLRVDTRVGDCGMRVLGGG